MKELSIVLDRYNRVISPNGLGDGAWGNTPRLGARPGNFLSVKRALFAVNHSSASNDVPGGQDRQSVAYIIMKLVGCGFSMSKKLTKPADRERMTAVVHAHRSNTEVH